MSQLIRILKIVLALGFLGVAYLFYADLNLFGIRPLVFALIIAVIGALVLSLDLHSRRRSGKPGDKRPQ